MEPSLEESKKSHIKLNGYLENHFRNSVAPQLFVDADLILRKFNPSARKHLNLSSDEVARHINDVNTKIYFPALIENIVEVMESNQELIKEMQTKDLRWYQMNISPYIVKKEQKAKGVIITFVDITGRIEVIKGYEKLNLKHENIIYAVSHDLKGALANIQGLIKLLESVTEDENKEISSIFEMVNLSVVQAKKTIEELTEIDKKHREAPEKINFESLMQDVQLGLKEIILKKGAKITAEINVPELDFSRKNIRSIVYNLLGNAIKYKAPDRTPEIFVKTEQVDGYVILSVRDNGVGIEEDKQEMIFLRNTRLRYDVEGTGTGLFIVKRMVEDIGGKIEVESTLDEGSIFKVYLKSST